MNWLIGQLFGSRAKAKLTDQVRAAVAGYISSNPGVTRDIAGTWADAEAAPIIARVVAAFPSWSRFLLTIYLQGQVYDLAAKAFDDLTKGASVK
jgi:hypothetical protein